MMPLTMAKTGEPVTIRKITGKDEVAGNLIVQVRGSRVALNEAMANRIMI